MPRFKEPDPLADAFKPSISDALALGRDLAKYSPRIINGKKQYPFEQYLEAKGIIRFGDFGEMNIKKPGEFHRLTQLNDLRQWKAEQDQEEHFQAFPEEREAWQARIAKIMQEIKEILSGKTASPHPS